MCISCLDRTFVQVLYFPFVSPTYQSGLIQLYHNNMKRSHNGCFFILQKEPANLQILLIMIYGARPENIIHRVLENFKNKLGIIIERRETNGTK